MGLRAIRDIGRETAMPGLKPAVNAVNRIIALLEQILRGAFTTVAVIAHYHHGGIETMLTHKRAQRIVSQVKRLRRMTHGITLRIANIDQHRPGAVSDTPLLQ